MLINLILALGVFIGNWLIVPLFLRSRTFKDGFFVGLIAGGICYGLTTLLGFVKLIP